MIKTLLALALFTSMAAQAECYYASSTKLQVKDKIDAIDNVTQMTGQGTCTIKARVQYKNQWHTITGQATDPNRESNARCLDAVENAVRGFLASQKSATAQDQMVCSDMPATQIRPVKIGETIRLSEVQPGSRIFQYKGAVCRGFVETNYVNQQLVQNEGVICKVGRPDADQWAVVDKW